MQPDGAGNQDDPPTLAGIEDFDELLRSGCFNRLSYKPQVRRLCFSWLEARTHELSIWIREYRASGPELGEPLLDIRQKLVGLYEQLDMLCDGPQSYVAIGRINLDEVSQGAYEEFIGAWDELRLSVLPRFLLFANAFYTAYKAGRLIDAEAAGIDSSELQKALLGNLMLMQKALKNLAKGLKWPLLGDR